MLECLHSFILPVCHDSGGFHEITTLQIRDDNSRVARKALQLCWNLCTNAPQLRATIAAADGFAASLATQLTAEDEHLQSSALQLLAQLADSQAAVTSLQQVETLRTAYRECRASVKQRFSQEPETFAEEMDLVNLLDEATALASELGAT